MNKRSGFTVVELLITMVVVAILLTLGVVGMRGVQANARDAERKSDIETVARGLEQRYRIGNTKNSLYKPGTYPGNNEAWQGPLWELKMTYSDVFGVTNTSATISPSGEKMTSFCVFYWAPAFAADCDAVEKPSNLQTAFANGTKDVYLYESIGADNKYCNLECRRYNLYWISETDKTVYKGIPGLKVMKSQHR